jgi:hypothetical protein
LFNEDDDEEEEVGFKLPSKAAPKLAMPVPQAAPPKLAMPIPQAAPPKAPPKANQFNYGEEDDEEEAF